MGNNLHSKQQHAIELLLAGHTDAEVASILKCRRETIWRWRRKTAFAATLSEARRSRRQAVAEVLDAAAIEAVRGLRDLATDKETPAAVRRAAFSDLLDRAGISGAQVIRVEQEFEKDLHHQQQIETCRVKKARESGGDVTAAMLEDVEEFQVILRALQNAELRDKERLSGGIMH